MPLCLLYRNGRLVCVRTHALPPDIEGIEVEAVLQFCTVGLARHLFAPRNVYCASRTLVGVSRICNWT